METPAPQICIIGAGSTGMTVAKSLLEKGLVFDCFEKGSQIGGMWRYQNDNGQSSAYASLHIDTSRPNLGYSDFPIDEDKPDFLSHAQFLEFLEAYAKKFDLVRHVTFNMAVDEILPLEDGSWDVKLSDGEIRNYQTVIVANGHLADPRLPKFDGKFDGEESHSHHYRTADPFENKKVLVVGIGNSAVDIAVDIARRTKHVFVSTRRSAWVMPKYLMGIPIDQWSGFLGRKLKLPTSIVRRVMSLAVRVLAGDQRRFGLPRPKHPMWREHATLSQELLPYIGHGYISVKPNVSELAGKEVVFNDGTREEVDAIVYATGYNVTFDFLPLQVFDPSKSAGQLYRRIISLDHPGLYFAGLVQPVGPTIPLVETQGKWIAAALSGEMKLPSLPEQQNEVAVHRKLQRDTYLGSDRYVLEVDYGIYSKQMRTDMTASAS